MPELPLSRGWLLPLCAMALAFHGNALSATRTCAPAREDVATIESLRVHTNALYLDLDHKRGMLVGEVERHRSQTAYARAELERALKDEDGLSDTSISSKSRRELALRIDRSAGNDARLLSGWKRELDNTRNLIKQVAASHRSIRATFMSVKGRFGPLDDCHPKYKELVHDEALLVILCKDIEEMLKENESVLSELIRLMSNASDLDGKVMKSLRNTMGAP